jgi:hypothetical protein
MALDLGKYSVKELANSGVDFYLVDEITGEDIPIKFVVYGMDSSAVSVAKREFQAVTNAKNVKPWKEEEAMLKFIVACIKSWDTITYKGTEIKDGDREGLMNFFDECPQFREQIIEFVTERDHFLAN